MKRCIAVCDPPPEISYGSSHYDLCETRPCSYRKCTNKNASVPILTTKNISVGDPYGPPGEYLFLKGPMHIIVFFELFPMLLVIR